MHTCYLSGGRLVATIRRIGNGTPTAPAQWEVYWGTCPEARDLPARRFNARLDAVACVLARFPDAVAETYDRTGRRVQ